MTENRAGGGFSEEWYPKDLEAAESRENGDKSVEAGLALSGGGVRSATFSLGFVQALSRWKLLPSLDYLSTVSGGGYTGSFLGYLFCSPGSIPPEPTPEAARDATRAAVDEILADNRSAPLRWLRENARYMNPRGAGDLPFLLGVLLRNWATVTLTVFTFLLMWAMVCHWLRGPLLGALPSLELEGLVTRMGWGDISKTVGILWLSPWCFLPALAALYALAAGCAYWLVGETDAWLPDWRLLLVLGSVAYAAADWLEHLRWEVRRLDAWLAGFLLAMAGLAVVLWLGTWMAERLLRVVSRRAPVRSASERRASEVRRLLSQQTTCGLQALLATTAFALVDSCGQSLFAVLSTAESWQFKLAVASTPVGLGLGAWLVQQAVGASFRRPAQERLPVSMERLAAVGALVTAAVLLLTVSTASHAVRFAGRVPAFAVPKAADGTGTWRPGEELLRAAGLVHAAARLPASGSQGTVKPQDADRTTAAVFYLALVSLLLGRAWDLLNRTSLHAVYSARLSRTYLGAADTSVSRDSSTNIQEVRAGCDLAWRAYQPHKHGGPIHIINVTINESVDSRTHLTNRDRKGLNLAIGPAGFSAGTRHHALFEPKDLAEADAAATPTLAASGLRLRPVSEGRRPTAIFPDGTPFLPEPLGLADWLGVSGAAFSTGLGSRTSLAYAFLCGAFNVRMGCWWHSGIPPERSLRSAARLMWPLSWFPVQRHLLDEWQARFHGVSRERWYLTDGGHFENMGVYELLRRRLKRIVLCDAEEDPEYTFEGLSNLVRKARIDFCTELEFMSAPAVAEFVHPDLTHLFGGIDGLRRGVWRAEPVEEPVPLALPAPADRRRRALSPSQARFSLARAALATIKYPRRSQDAPDEHGLLLYIKPTLTGHEPADLLQYHEQHPDFPQQPTLDQFFDEAQWESYRKLGSHIGESLLRPIEGGGVERGDWTPHAWLSA